MNTRVRIGVIGVNADSFSEELFILAHSAVKLVFIPAVFCSLQDTPADSDQPARGALPPGRPL